MSQATNTPPGWYPDQSGQQRWWDGTQWTDHVQQAYGAGSIADLKAPEGTSWNTVWIWLILFVPLLSLIPLLTIDWTSYITQAALSATGSLGLLTSPGYLAAIVLGWPIYGLTVFFSYRDFRELTKRGVPRPFHWAFAFISSIVYAIGRSVVVKRRTGHGSIPLWVAIGTIVLSFVYSIYLTVVIIQATLNVVTALVPSTLH